MQTHPYAHHPTLCRFEQPHYIDYIDTAHTPNGPATCCPPLNNHGGYVTGAWQQERGTMLSNIPDLLKRACGFCCSTSTKSPGRVSTLSSPSPSSTCRRPRGDPRAMTKWKVLLSLQALPQLSTLHLSLDTHTKWMM